jgi:hypothetical protein
MPAMCCGTRGSGEGAGRRAEELLLIAFEKRETPFIGSNKFGGELAKASVMGV